MASFLSHLKTIGEDILKGVEVAVKILPSAVAVVDPPLAPILTEIAQIIASLEGGGSTISAENLSAVIQAITTASVVKSQINPPVSSTTVQTTTSQ